MSTSDERAPHAVVPGAQLSPGFEPVSALALGTLYESVLTVARQASLEGFWREATRSSRWLIPARRVLALYAEGEQLLVAGELRRGRFIYRVAEPIRVQSPRLKQALAQKLPTWLDTLEAASPEPGTLEAWLGEKPMGVVLVVPLGDGRTQVGALVFDVRAMEESERTTSTSLMTIYGLHLDLAYSTLQAQLAQAQRERALRDANRAMRRLGGVSSEAGLYDASVREARESLGGAYAVLLLRRVDAWSIAAEDGLYPSNRLRMGGRFFEWILEGGEPCFWDARQESFAEELAPLLASRMGEGVAAPIRFDAQLSGVLLVANTQHHREDIYRLELLEQIGHALAAGHRQVGQMALERQTAEAEERSQAKSQFLANMSHELRTPMNGILGMAQLLETTALDEEQTDYLGTLRRSGADLLRLIDDLLDVSSIEAGRVALEFQPFEPSVELRDLGLAISPEAAAKGVEVAVEVEEAPAVLGDRGRFRQIVSHLLSNAVKFTDMGQVRIEMRCAVEAGGCRLLVDVVDTGVGIESQMLDRLFHEFAQADDSDTRRHGGLGLGLVLVRLLVDLMGGGLSVDSTVGQGSRFRFSLVLPLAIGAMTVASGPVHRRFPGAKVLLADDNPTNRRVVRTLLERLGCRVDVVDSGREALERLEAESTDLVFMDCDMPGLSGFDATRAIRSHEAERGRSRLPIVALTANARVEDIQRCQEAGMDSHLAKPITRAELVDALERHLWSAS